MDPRIALFQRKGAAPPTGAPIGLDRMPEPAPPAEGPAMVSCPECGCEFDPMAPPPVDEAPGAAVMADEEGM